MIIDGEVMMPREASMNVNEVTMARVECGSHLASTLGYTDDAVALVCQQPFNVCHQAVPPIQVEVHLWDEANVHHACKRAMHTCCLAAAASCDRCAICLVWLGAASLLPVLAADWLLHSLMTL